MAITTPNAADHRWFDARVEQAVNVIRRQRGRVNIDLLAERLGITRRHLERRFDLLVGISPKRLARTSRFQHALRILTGSMMSGAAAAVECGYADQSHFIREFTELAGCSPSSHLLRRVRLSGLFTAAPL